MTPEGEAEDARRAEEAQAAAHKAKERQSHYRNSLRRVGEWTLWLLFKFGVAVLALVAIAGVCLVLTWASVQEDFDHVEAARQQVYAAIGQQQTTHGDDDGIVVAKASYDAAVARYNQSLSQSIHTGLGFPARIPYSREVWH